MCALMPAAAAYAAIDAPALPEESSTNSDIDSSTAVATSTALPLSLKEPVGDMNSSLAVSFAKPSRSPVAVNSTRGVLPCPRLIELSHRQLPSATSRYRISNVS